jgi:hypothetical protein
MTLLDYSETNDRDYWLYEDSTGDKYHKKADREYQNARSTQYHREHPEHRSKKQYPEYQKKYYQEHRERIIENQRLKYDTAKNTERCRRYREENAEMIKCYQREYYIAHAEEKRRKARERYYARKKEQISATG